jgi:hypothetical protein
MFFLEKSIGGGGGTCLTRPPVTDSLAESIIALLMAAYFIGQIAIASQYESLRRRSPTVAPTNIYL